MKAFRASILKQKFKNRAVGIILKRFESQVLWTVDNGWKGKYEFRANFVLVLCNHVRRIGNIRICINQGSEDIKLRTLHCLLNRGFDK